MNVLKKQNSELADRLKIMQAQISGVQDEQDKKLVEVEKEFTKRLKDVLLTLEHGVNDPKKRLEILKEIVE